MKAFLNSRELCMEVESFADSLTLLEHVRDKELPSGDIITGLTVDGIEVTEYDTQSVRLSGGETIERIEIFSESAIKRLNEALGRSVTAVESIRLNLTEATERLRIGEDKDGHDRVAAFVKFLKDVFHVIALYTPASGITLEQALAQESGPAEALKTAPGVMTELVQRLDARDPLDLADYLEHEFDIFLERLLVLLKHLRDQMPPVM